MPTFTPRQVEDVLDRVFAKGGDATVAFLLRLANERAERAAAAAPKQPDSPDSPASESRPRQVKRRR